MINMKYNTAQADTGSSPDETEDTSVFETDSMTRMLIAGAGVIALLLLILLIAVYQLADGIQNVSVGILRGIQDVKIIMPIAFLSYIVFNLPVGYLLGFTLGMGAQGLILGFTVGLTTAAVLLIVRYRRDIRRWKAGIR